MMLKMKNAGILESPNPASVRSCSLDECVSLDERIEMLFDIVNTPKRNPTDMLFFVMYDIESNKVRRQVVKYLEQKGCHRIQKSIFLADLPSSQYDMIRNDLTAVQACYDNEDSILVVPISTDYLRAMRIIGQNINLDVITRSKNTLFF